MKIIIGLLLHTTYGICILFDNDYDLLGLSFYA